MSPIPLTQANDGDPHPLDSVSTPASRSRRRYARITLTAATSSISRVIAFLTGAVTVPLLVAYLGAERYALWATISSTMAFLGIADLGISNGLLNAISESDGNENREAAITYASTGFVLLVSVALAAGVVFSLSYTHVPWARILNVSSPLAIREAGPTVAILVMCFLIYLPATVAQRIQLGYQRGYVNQGWEAAGNVLAIAGLLLAIRGHAGLAVVALAVTGGPVLSGVLNALTLFSFRSWIRPRLFRFSLVAAKQLVTLGFLFVVIQFANATAYQTDNLILAQLLGASAVTGYAVPLKLFGFAPAIISLLAAPLWPAYSEAMARGDFRWVRQTLLYSLTSVGVVSMTVGLVLVFAAPAILRFWVGPMLVPSFLLLVGMGMWTVLSSITGTLAMFLNGVGCIRMQAICSVLMASVNVVLSIGLTRRIGVSGVIYGTVISHAIFILVPYGYVLPRLLRKLGQPDVGWPLLKTS